VLKCHPILWTDIEVSSKIFFAVDTSTVVVPVIELTGASPTTDNIMFIACNSVVGVIRVLIISYKYILDKTRGQIIHPLDLLIKIF
jgi:flagellar biosynthesis protein FliR